MYNRESQVGNMFNRERKIPSLFEVRPSMNSQEKIHVKLFYIFTIHLAYYQHSGKQGIFSHIIHGIFTLTEI
jgi:hypothetical protein